MRMFPFGGPSGIPAATTAVMNAAPRTVKQSVPLRHRARGLSVWRVVLLALLCAVAVPWPAHAGPLAQFRTTLGTIDVELYDQDKPVTVQNFLRYVQGGVYMNMILHRGVAGFIIQGGGIFITNRTTVPAFAYVAAYPTITNEINVGRFFSNTYGTIAMAKTRDPNSASSQFFFNLANNSASLDNPLNSGGFTVFGRVVGGTNVLNLLNPTAQNTTIKLFNLDDGVLAELPVLAAANPAALSVSDLLYVDISLLNVRVSATNGTRFITWNSVSNRLNTVEYTTVFPPVWQSLTNLTGNGTDRVFADLAADSARRFYRVRVDY